MKIYIINLESNNERRNFMKEQMSRLQLDYEFFPGVDGRKLSESDFLAQSDIKWLRRYEGRVQTRGMFGCALSHVLVYNKIVAERVPYALILEDDAWLTPSTVPVLAMLEQKQPFNYFDVLLFSECQIYGKTVWRDSEYSIKEVKSAIFTHAYVVTAHGAYVLSKILYPICHVPDCWTWLVKHCLVKVRVLHPVLATQDQKILGGLTSIGASGIGKPYSAQWLSYKICRAFWKFMDTLGYHVPNVRKLSDRGGK